MCCFDLLSGGSLLSIPRFLACSLLRFVRGGLLFTREPGTRLQGSRPIVFGCWHLLSLGLVVLLEGENRRLISRLWPEYTKWLHYFELRSLHQRPTAADTRQVLFAFLFSKRAQFFKCALNPDSVKPGQDLQHTSCRHSWNI